MTKMMWFKGKGFTLVEIMIVVAIIGLLAAIAIPNFVKARATARKNMCINNLRLMDAAKEQYAIEEKLDKSSDVSLVDFSSYFKTGAEPTCPEGGGSYVITTVAADPTCPNVLTYTDHVLP